MKENWVYRRGDLYLANLGVPVGSKQGGVRPVVVLQNDVGNYYAPTITIAPLTSKIEKKRKQPTHFFLRKAKGLAKPSMVLAEQLDTCDKICCKIPFQTRRYGGRRFQSKAPDPERPPKKAPKTVKGSRQFPGSAV